MSAHLNKEHEQAFRDAVSMQRQAAIPDQSVFVSANAGSGKTRVLVDRVSRILLSGTAPDKILCLTYTKAAASEMQERLFAALGKWSIIDKDDLAATLNTLEGVERPRGEDELGRARRLFARALETPGGLKVQTIHAFCERLLKRFPLEAGLSPGSEAIDERDAKALYAQIVAQIETEALAEPSGTMAIAIRLLAAQKSDQDLDDIYGWAMGNAYKVDAWMATGGTAALAARLGVEDGLSADTIMEAAWTGAPKDQIKAAASEMQAGGKTDQRKADQIFAALNTPDTLRAYRLYESIFFTQSGTPNASMVTAKAGATALAVFGDKKSGYQPEALRMIAAREQVKAAGVLELTRAIYDIAAQAVQKYRALKARRRVMDFDDQIYLAQRLLMDSAAKEWVKYKLDGGVDHVLVDEAQDTSDAQWEIIEALSDEFFQPAPDRDPKHKRTLFAVGDEKQSIYSFQGAQPEAFREKILALGSKQKQTPDVRMQMSFRSASQVLQLVDQVFYGDGAITESFSGELIGDGGHVARRFDPGLVEFWPASTAPEKGEPEIAWNPEPVDAPKAQSTREQLARQIAVQVKEWLDHGEPVYDRTAATARPMQARDIMILVTKRLPFFDAIIRNLKEHGVPVAGADRLQLSESIVVQDLLSLAKFTLLPSDDLSLAEVLKSPLIGWDEEALFHIAHNRGERSLWQAMPDGADKTLLKRIQSLAAKYAPYEFFARVLALTPAAGGKSLLGEIYQRVGIEAADAVDAFLARALAHQRRAAPSLSRFVAKMDVDENKIKREMDTAQNEVRVMTVHAAKGLEAPVVILPDTTQLPSVSKERLYPVGDGFVANVKSVDRPAAMDNIVDEALASVRREHLRLLYVALTRAESRLLICGYESNGKVSEGSWHDRVGVALNGLSQSVEYETPFGTGLRYGEHVTSAIVNNLKSQSKIQLPDFLTHPMTASKSSKRRLSPSKLIEGAEFDVPVKSPIEEVSQTGLGRFGRGNIIHKLLQILPDLPLSERRQAAENYLSKQDKIDANQIITEVFAVLDHKDYAPFFAEGSQAEIALAGSFDELPDDVELSGQIDRLSVQRDTVWILDYKSNRPPPNSEEKVSPIYIKQMAAYRALVQQLYPEKRIICALLWTDGPHLMPLSNTLLDNVSWQSDLPA